MADLEKRPFPKRAADSEIFLNRPPDLDTFRKTQILFPNRAPNLETTKKHNVHFQIGRPIQIHRKNIMFVLFLNLFDLFK